MFVDIQLCCLKKLKNELSASPAHVLIIYFWLARFNKETDYPHSKNLSEGSHGLSIVVGNKSLKKRNGSLKPLLRDESHDTNHSKTSIVQLLNKTIGLGLLTLVLREAKGIKKVEGDRVGDHAVFGKGWVLSWNTTTHVVSASGFTEPFQKSNEENDLPLGSIRECIPLFRRGSSGVGVGSATEISGEGPVNSVGLNNVSDEGGHGNTSVLDLTLTQECDGFVIGVTPDSGGGKLKWIVELLYIKKQELSIKVATFLQADKSIT